MPTLQKVKNRGMSDGKLRQLCFHCGLAVNDLEFHFGVHEECWDMELKGRRAGGSFFNNLARSSKVTLPNSDNKGSLTSGGGRKSLKSKSLRDEKNERVGSNSGSEFVGSFADFLKQGEEGETARERKKHEERLRKAASSKAKKAEGLDCALAFIDKFITPGSDLSDSDEMQSEEGADESPVNKEPDNRVKRPNLVEANSASSNFSGEERAGLQPSDFLGEKVKSSMEMEAETQDGNCRVTKDTCSTSADIDVKPDLLKLEKSQNAEKIVLMIHFGTRKFNVKIEGERRIGKLKEAVARQIGVRPLSVQMRLSGRSLDDNSLIGDLNLDGSFMYASLV